MAGKEYDRSMGGGVGWHRKDVSTECAGRECQYDVSIGCVSEVSWAVFYCGDAFVLIKAYLSLYLTLQSIGGLSETYKKNPILRDIRCCVEYGTIYVPS